MNWATGPHKRTSRVQGVVTPWWVGSGEGKALPSLPPDRPGGQRGGALMLVLVLMSVLSMVAIESLRRAQIEVESAGTYLGGVQCRELCESGLRLAALLLERDMDLNDYDAPTDLWVTFFEDEDAKKTLNFQTGVLRVEISPEDGRFPLSAMTTETGRQVMQRLLVGPPYNLEQESAARLVTAMRDWIDADEDGEFEKPLYMAEEVAYRPRNAAMASLDELLLVRGMPRGLFYGGQGVPGLRDLLTVHGSKVNINTAPALVLMALCPDDVSRATAANLAQDMLAFRASQDNAGLLNKTDWYKTALSGYEQVTLQQELLSVSSDVFQVVVTAKAGAVQRSLRAVLRRTAGQADPQKPVSRVSLERKVLG
ncbi:general secretion pathway protein GspK [Desulfocurvibacter africanus]|uniref:general secretion pathway protein GspK n=1 Tax=Desulfocurvibacter africanus TaxID=873 RepID=UPI0013769516|nr:type II secretion system protein GspK [Desulfocurvibacter africanus]